MNFALSLQYVGAQFYSMAAGGRGLSAALLGGMGVQGGLKGGRQVSFTDPYLSRYASEFAADQVATITRMRTKLGAAAGAQPTIDLSPAAFGTIGRATVLGGSFDPFSSDTSFLIGGLILEHGVAGAYRTMLTGGTITDADDMLTGAMGDAVYRDGLIRAMLADKAQNDPSLAATVSSVFAELARLQANAVSQEPQTIDQPNSSVSDAEGYPIALTRSANEVFRLLYLNVTGTSGGLLPAGVNGVEMLPGLQ